MSGDVSCGSERGSRGAYVNALKPDGDVGNECDRVAELGGDFTFVDVVGETVGDYVVCEVFKVVFRAGFCTCP